MEDAIRRRGRPRKIVKIKVLEHAGFNEYNGECHVWHKGDIITDQNEIAMIVSRRIPYEEVV